jgi:hypothetical protein
MVASLKHWKARDWRFAGWVGLTLMCIGLYLSMEGPGMERTHPGWRRIDRAALQQRIDSGDLRKQEAQWYHPAKPGEHSGEASGR